MESLLNRQGRSAVIRLVDPVAESNCYVICGEKSCLVIDPNNFEMLEELFKAQKLCPAMVILTHGHCDHISGLNELRKHYAMPVIATKGCSEEMQNMKLNMSRMMEMFLYYKSGEKKLVPYSPFTCDAADIEFEDETTVTFEETDIWLKALPGHTHGSCVIYCEEILYCGDYLLPDDKVVTRLPGGSDEEYEAYARPWLKTVGDGTIICPGHGVPYVMSREMRNRHDL